MLMKMFFKILTWRNSWKALRRLAMLTWTVKVFKTAAQDQTRVQDWKNILGLNTNKWMKPFILSGGP